MENKALKRIITLACLIWLAPGMSQASGMMVYGGLGAGYSVLDNPPPATDSASGAGKVYLGLDLFGPFGLEATYYNLGKYNDGKEQVTATSVALLARVNSSMGSLFVKGGGANWKVKDTTNTIEISGNDIVYGLGFEIPIAMRTIFRAEWERFNNVGKDTVSAVTGNDISLLTLSINYLF